MKAELRWIHNDIVSPQIVAQQFVSQQKPVHNDFFVAQQFVATQKC